MMRILFVTEYFYPYIHGGAEISVYQLARKLNRNKFNVTILTPKYGSLKNEIVDGIPVARFPWPLHLKSVSSQLSPVFFANPIAWIYLTIVILLWNRKNKAGIFHAQSVNSFPGVWLAARLSGKKCVVNIRDNQVLCNYGHCLSNNNGGKTCTLSEYFFEDFRQYYKDKVKEKNLTSFVVNLMFAVVGRFRCRILRFFVHKADRRICGSLSQKKTLMVNGIFSDAIYNIYEFPSKLILNRPTDKTILYATKMSSGKGLDLLLAAFKQVTDKYPDAKLIIVGGGDLEYYEKMTVSLKINKSVSFLGRMTPEEVMRIRRTVLLEVAPSIYPESFGRTVLDALSLGVPAIVTNRGGLPEIVENNKTGYVVEPEEKSLADGIIKGIEHNTMLRKNIFLKYPALKNKFNIRPTKQLIDLYKDIR